ncbi:MAG TPA: dTMP kinase [Solirubrobacteraceae bacterium]|nr:dTMP kinase [Solirubrobacteraceae bacterium]
MKRGRLITIEGIDGAGKSTLAAGLLNALTDRGVDIKLLREPGGVPAAERIREVVIDPDLHVTARTEALLYAAARAQLVEEAIEPLLSAGTWLLLDRFIDSSLAYQGGGRELGIDAVRAINDFAIRTARPDRTLLLLIEPQRGRSRQHSRTGGPDRLEREHDDFFERTIAAYIELSSQDPDRIRTIDASMPADQVLAAALGELADLIPEPKPA